MQPSERRGLLPFALCALAGVATLAAPPYGHDWGHITVALVLLLGAIALEVRTFRRSSWDALPPFLLFVVIAILRDASGGSSSGLGALVILPVLWVAMYGTRFQMWLATAFAGLVFLAPLVVIGGDQYPSGDWRRALIWVLVAATVGPVVHDVVRRLHVREKRQAEMAAHLDGVLTSATEHAIIATSVDGTITTFNTGAEQLLGYTADEVVGRLTPAVIHDPDEVAARATELGIEPGFEVFVSAAREGTSDTRDWTYVAKDGHRVPVRLTVTAVRDDDGEVFGFLGIARDITAEKEALDKVTAAEQRWRVLLDHLPDTSVLTVDEDLRYDVAVGAGLDEQGMAAMSGRTLEETSSPDNVVALGQIYASALEGHEATVEVLATHTGRVNHVTAVPLPARGDRREALVVARDVTDTRRREQQLAAAKERLSSLFEEAPFGVVVCRVDGQVTDVNPAACHLVGRTRDALVSGYAFPFGADPADVARVAGELASSPSGRLAAETRIQHADGHWVDLAFEGIVMHDRDGVPTELLFNAVDVSERRRFEAQLAHLADHDPLTGLANRRRFDQELERHLDLCERYGPRGALLMMDLDHFKEVNDTLGHGAGDQLIVSVAELLRMRMRRSDLVARLGGDEFAILLPEADRASAHNVARDIVRLVEQQASFLDGSRPRRLTASIGVVLIERAGITAGQLVSTADMTMYDAKESGRNRFVILDTKDFAVPKSAAQLAWGQRIAEAMADDRLVLHAQPIFGVAEQEIVGAELLLRMRDEKGNLIMPGRFLYIAERLGLITPLDQWVAGEAIDLLARLRTINPRFHIEVNLSAHSIGDPDLADHLVDRITDSGIDPTKLVFELTETAAVANIETAREFADRLGRLGCRFALDDFGAGFGSFYYLKHLPFDFVKIDGEFVEKSPTNFTDRLILASIVDIARGLGKRAIAEFVATEEIQQVCLDQGVDYLQGYHVGRPVPLEQVLDWAAGERVVGGADTPPRVVQA